MAQFYALLNCAPLLRWTTEQTTRCDHEAGGCDDGAMYGEAGAVFGVVCICILDIYI